MEHIMIVCIAIQLLFLNATALTLPAPDFPVSLVNRGQSDIHFQPRIYGRISKIWTGAAYLQDVRSKCSHPGKSLQLEKSFPDSIELSPTLADQPKEKTAISPAMQYNHEQNHERTPITELNRYFPDRPRSKYILHLPTKGNSLQMLKWNGETFSTENIGATPHVSLIKRTLFPGYDGHTAPIRLPKSSAPKRTTSHSQWNKKAPAKIKPLCLPGSNQARRHSFRATNNDDKEPVRVPEEEMKKIYAKAASDRLDVGLNLLAPVIGASTQFPDLPFAAKCGLGLAAGQAVRRCLQIEQEQKDAISAAEQRVRTGKQLSRQEQKISDQDQKIKRQDTKIEDQGKGLEEQRTKLEGFGKRLDGMKLEMESWSGARERIGDMLSSPSKNYEAGTDIMRDKLFERPTEDKKVVDNTYNTESSKRVQNGKKNRDQGKEGQDEKKS